MERDLGECIVWMWLKECMHVIKIWKINKKSGILPPNLKFLFCEIRLVIKEGKFVTFSTRFYKYSVCTLHTRVQRFWNSLTNEECDPDLSRFIAFGFTKSTNMTAKNDHKNSMKEPKTLNLKWISKLLNKGLPQIKVRLLKTFAHSAERKKPTWFLLFYDDIFLFRNFLATFFQQILNQQKILLFLHPYYNFFKFKIKIYFFNVNQNKPYFTFPGPDYQVLKSLYPNVLCSN